MHGQKKRATRSIKDTVIVDGIELEWQLVAEPAWIVGEELRGFRISAQATGGGNRELILQYPFPNKRNSKGLPAFSQRPRVVPKTIEADIRRAIAIGWDPSSRGKAMIVRVDEFSN